MMHPKAWNLHDWAEIYFEGIGWVPVDQSFGIPTFARNADEEYFFLGGIDSWRMIVNSDYGMPLIPEKNILVVKRWISSVVKWNGREVTFIFRSGIITWI